MVDVGAGELCCDVPDGTAEDRIHKVLLLEKGALVVWAFASVVERKDTRVFFPYQACSLVLPADRIVRMGRVERSCWSSALVAALVLIRLVGKSILFRNPRQEAGELGVGCRVLTVLEKLESGSVFCGCSKGELFAALYKT